MTHRWHALGVLALSLLLIAMDATILNVALPALSEDLQPTPTQVLWIVDVYGLVLAGLLVAMGGLGDRVGRRRLLTAGLVVFGLASAMAAAAPSAEALIAARALLGVGGAMIMPSTLSILRNIFTDSRERTIALGIWSAVAAGGFALGPVLGGALLEFASWHLVLAINVPVMAGCLLATRRWIPESRNPDPGPWDPIGVALSVVGMVSLVWGVKHGGEYGFGDPAAIAALVAAVVLISIFVRRQMRSDAPLVDVRLFASRRFTGSVTAVLFTFLGLAALLLYLTQFHQVIEGRGPLESGARLLPLALAAGLAGLVTDAVVRRIGPALAIGGAFAVMAAALAGLSGLQPGDAYVPIAVALAAIGFGAGIVATAGSASIMSAAPPERAGGAAAVQETAFELGGALGVAVLGSVFNAAARAGGFMDGYEAATLAGAGLLLAAAVVTAMLLRTWGDGSDGTRTRDLRRDRPAL